MNLFGGSFPGDAQTELFKNKSSIWGHPQGTPKRNFSKQKQVLFGGPSSGSGTEICRTFHEFFWGVLPRGPPNGTFQTKKSYIWGSSPGDPQTELFKKKTFHLGVPPAGVAGKYVENFMKLLRGVLPRGPPNPNGPRRPK